MVGQAGREDAVALVRVRHDGHVGLLVALAAALPTAEEKRLVPADGPAERGAELVLPQRFGVRLAVPVAVHVVEHVARIEDVVAHVLVRRAVELVRARLDADDHHRAGVLAELGGVVAGLHLELRHGVERRHHHLHLAVLHPHHVVVVVDAVDEEAVLRHRLAVRVEPALTVAAGGGGGHAGSEPRKLLEIPAVQRERADLVLLDHLGERGGLRLQQRRLGGDRDAFGHLADFQFQVHAHAVLRVQFDFLLDRFLEPRLLDRHVIPPDAERADGIRACIGRIHRSDFAGLAVRRGDAGGGNARPGGVGNNPRDDTHVLLRQGGARPAARTGKLVSFRLPFDGHDYIAAHAGNGGAGHDGLRHAGD